MTGVVHKLKSFVNAGLSFFYPEICQVCKESRATPAEGFVCADCKAKVQIITRPFCERCGIPVEGAITTAFECSNCKDENWQFRWARSAGASKDPLLEIIHQYKYSRALWYEPFLAQLLISQALPELGKGAFQYIVPVPLHPAKQREREFNQAERLGRRLGAAAGIPVNTRLLRRAVATPSQTLLSREERVKNMKNAFAMRPKEGLNGERILLVDDVLTTGATTGACASVLLEAGASEVCVWTVARGI
jgi:ComF family protein